MEYKNLTKEEEKENDYVSFVDVFIAKEDTRRAKEGNNPFSKSEMARRLRDFATKNKMTNHDKVIEDMDTLVCKTCRGDGFTAEHDPLDPHENGCSSCPIQVPCDDCHGEGKYATLDTVRQALQDIYQQGREDEAIDHQNEDLNAYEQGREDGENYANDMEKSGKSDITPINPKQ